MGRKLPKSKKQKKLKFVDPCYKGPGPCSKKKKLLVNEPPSQEDYQEMPKGMQEIMDFKKNAKLNKLKRKKKKKNYKDDFIIVKNNIHTNEPGMEKAVKKIPRILKQRKTENEVQFINRLQKMSDMALAEAKIEEKYNIELVNVDKSGNAQYKSELKVTSEAKKEKRKKYKEKVRERKRLKRDDENFDLKKEQIKFGQIVAAPPILTAKPKKAPEVNKAGEKKLALKNYLGESNEKKILNAKWKDLALDKRKELENERARAVQMYRLLKNKKSLL